MIGTWRRRLSAVGAAAAVVVLPSTGWSRPASPVRPGRALVCPPGTGRAGSTIRVRVDPRVELISIVFRLAGHAEYTMGRVESYTSDLDVHFARFTDHPVVVRARQLRRTRGISFNAPMSLAVHLTDPPELAERVPFDPLPPGIDPRWTVSEARAFLADLRSFVREAKVMEFLAGHAALYRAATGRLETLARQARVAEWLDAFFGQSDDRQFLLVAGLLNGGGNYGAWARGVSPAAGLSLAERSTADEFYSIVGTESMDENDLPSYPPRAAGTIVHEFCHSFVNPIVDAHEGELRGVTDRLYSLVASQMQSQAYGLPKAMMCESLVRACTVRYLEKNLGADAARREAALDRGSGFAWVERLAEVFKDYERDRSRFATLDTFVPRVVAFFEDYNRIAADELRTIESEQQARSEALAANGPTIVSMSPPNGAIDVDAAAVTEISILFDRPMRDRNFAVFPVPKAMLPALKGMPRFDRDGRTLRLTCHLRPGVTYGLQFNSPEHLAFVDAEGRPLAPFVYRFGTRK